MGKLYDLGLIDEEGDSINNEMKLEELMIKKLLNQQFVK